MYYEYQTLNQTLIVRYSKVRGVPIYAAFEDNVANSSRSTSNCLATRLSLLALCSAVNLGSRHGLAPGWMLELAVEPRVLGK